MMLPINAIKWAHETITALLEMGFEMALDKAESWNWYNAHVDELIDLDVAFYRGETKICIMPEDPSMKWVLKTGFDGMAEDYCRLEAENYLAAINAECEEFFATTYFVGKREGHRFYLQEFAFNDEDEIDSSIFDYVESHTPIGDDDDEEHECRIYDEIDYMEDDDRLDALFLEEHGDDAMARLHSFIYEEGINDLHTGNFGTTGDGRRVIIDFSGYHG